MRANSLLLTVYIIISGLLIISCKKSVDNTPAITKDVILPQNGSAVVNAHNQFAFDFLRTTLQNDPTGSNKLVSPLSIYLALSMVSNGAKEATLEGIRQALQLNNISINDLNKTCQSLIKQLPGVDNKVELNIANSIFYRQDIPPVTGFLTVNNEYYHADVRSLNFSSPDALATINKWASDNTHQKINKILQNIDPDDFMYLLNAIYFKGTWQYPFDKNNTVNNSFFTAQGTKILTPFMFQHNAKLKYFRNDSMQMAGLSYGGGNFNMYVLLPGATISVAGLLSAINGASFHNWQTQVLNAQMDLYFPKFKFSYGIESMKPHLSSMGMGLSFTDNANFSNMYTIPQVHITKAVHKTYIEVNEEGTEAAAVTSIGSGVTSLPPPSVLRLDRPFVFVIAEKSSGTILFTGLMNNPTL